MAHTKSGHLGLNQNPKVNSPRSVGPAGPTYICRRDYQGVVWQKNDNVSIYRDLYCPGSVRSSHKCLQDGPQQKLERIISLTHPSGLIVPVFLFAYYEVLQMACLLFAL